MIFERSTSLLANTFVALTALSLPSTALALARTRSATSSEGSTGIASTNDTSQALPPAECDDLQRNVPFVGDEPAGSRVTCLRCLCHSAGLKLETHATFSEDGCRVSGEAGTLHNSDRVCSQHLLPPLPAARHFAALLPPAACKDACASAKGSCETVTFLVSANAQPQLSPDEHHLLSLTSSQPDLAETSRSKFVRLLLPVLHNVLLGLQKVLLGSVVMLWMLMGAATIGCVLTVGLWLQRQLKGLGKRREMEPAMDAGFRTRRRSRGRRVRWLDEVEAGLELAEGRGGSGEGLTADNDVAVDVGKLERPCERGPDG